MNLKIKNFTFRNGGLPVFFGWFRRIQRFESISKIEKRDPVVICLLYFPDVYLPADVVFLEPFLGVGFTQFRCFLVVSDAAEFPAKRVIALQE